MNEYAKEMLAGKCWWSPVFDEEAGWIEFAIRVKHWSQEEVIAKGTEAWLRKRVEDWMFNVLFTPEQWKEFVEYKFAEAKELGWL